MKDATLLELEALKVEALKYSHVTLRPEYLDRVAERIRALAEPDPGQPKQPEKPKAPSLWRTGPVQDGGAHLVEYNDGSHDVQLLERGFEGAIQNCGLVVKWIRIADLDGLARRMTTSARSESR